MSLSSRRVNSESNPQRILVCIATSEKTFYKLPSCCYNEYFLRQRPHFDVAVVFSGTLTDEAQRCILLSKPDYFFTRENIGYDLQAFDYLLRRVPDYELYILMHDDHYFMQANWLSEILRLVSQMTAIDVFGNLVKLHFLTEHEMRFFEAVALACSCEDLLQIKQGFFAQGVAGVFRQRVIKWLMQNGGIPKVTNPQYLSGLRDYDKAVAEAIERLVSLKLTKQGFRFAQLPPGYEQFLHHKSCI